MGGSSIDLYHVFISIRHKDIIRAHGYPARVSQTVYTVLALVLDEDLHSSIPLLTYRHAMLIH